MTLESWQDWLNDWGESVPIQSMRDLLDDAFWLRSENGRLETEWSRDKAEVSRLRAALKRVTEHAHLPFCDQTYDRPCNCHVSEARAALGVER